MGVYTWLVTEIVFYLEPGNFEKSFGYEWTCWVQFAKDQKSKDYING